MRAAMGSILATAVFLGGCGGGSDGGGGGGGGSCTPGTTAAVAIAATGFTPRAVCVRPGGTVTLTNSDTAPHDIESGMTCQMLNLGAIPGGEARTVTFPTAMTCTFFDAAHSTEAAFQGTVAVSTGRVTGPGY